ncbi:putative U2 small nuclear ribonucleoprotein A' [Giardia muris]|uniref:Putative U2 small nuclear ribonucleoprotein A n=1 Tax=Giardia muris TaxID=5742 RepID=A0A4Z1T544_GIAMU|nr:putative U2 small nuclear ribonucleoprotein A' [Giardia muris]|eukprot:TNJ27639.1 putative U2 small nuclear ribonucleoprotein A' [Giardia muris]
MAQRVNGYTAHQLYQTEEQGGPGNRARPRPARTRYTPRPSALLSTFLEAHPSACTNGRINAVEKDIEMVGTIPTAFRAVHTLFLSNNRVSTLTGLVQFARLRTLSLAYNNIHDFRELAHLSGLRELRTLRLDGNPIAKEPEYRLRVIATVSDTLSSLDGVDVTEKERIAAAQLAADIVDSAESPVENPQPRRTRVVEPPVSKASLLATEAHTGEPLALASGSIDVGIGDNWRERLQGLSALSNLSHFTTEPLSADPGPRSSLRQAISHGFIQPKRSGLIDSTRPAEVLSECPSQENVQEKEEGNVDESRNEIVGPRYRRFLLSVAFSGWFGAWDRLSEAWEVAELCDKHQTCSRYFNRLWHATTCLRAEKEVSYRSNQRIKRLALVSWYSLVARLLTPQVSLIMRQRHITLLCRCFHLWLDINRSRRHERVLCSLADGYSEIRLATLKTHFSLWRMRCGFAEKERYEWKLRQKAFGSLRTRLYRRVIDHLPEALETTKGDSRTMIEELERRLGIAQERNTALAREVKASLSSHQALRDQYTALERRYDALRATLDGQEGAVAQRDRRIAALEAELTSLRKVDYGRVETECADLALARAEVRTVTEKYTRMAADAQAFQGTIARLEVELANRDATLTDTLETNRQLRAAIITAEAARAEMASQVAVLEAQLLATQARCTALGKTMEQDRLTQGIQLAESQRLVEEARQETNGLREEIGYYKELEQLQKTQITSLEIQTETLEQRERVLQEQLLDIVHGGPTTGKTVSFIPTSRADPPTDPDGQALDLQVEELQTRLLEAFGMTDPA